METGKTARVELWGTIRWAAETAGVWSIMVSTGKVTGSGGGAAVAQGGSGGMMTARKKGWRLRVAAGAIQRRRQRRPGWNLVFEGSWAGAQRKIF